MGRTILVTGANGNLGRATVKKLLDDGHTVIAAGRSGTVGDLEPGNSHLVYKTVDFSDEQASASFVEELVTEYKTVEGALLLVGGFAMGDVKTTGSAELGQMYRLNFETAYHVARPLFMHMLEKGFGRIVLVGSRPALVPAQGKNTIAYTLSKSLLFTLAQLLNESANGKNVVTSVIVPSIIDTPQNRESMPKADPGKWVKAEQVAEVLSFICSDAVSALREPVYKIYNNA